MTTSAPDILSAPATRDAMEFRVGGMTCSSCAARIERQLNRLDGVAATVSYATERAYVTSAGGRRPAELISVIETAGYTAELASGLPDAAGSDDSARPMAPGCLHSAVDGDDRSGHDSCLAVSWLAVDQPAARHPRRGLGRHAHA